ncbi:MAG: hypothetical protein JWP63_303 [Candidatus Solibacter sp.]|nr:hypothetical protein [Candidatus Solibacter sp.]
MTTAIETGTSLCKTFVTAVLLTGNTNRAEAAILEGIASLDNPEDSAELLARTLDSLLLQDDAVGAVPSSLPPELQRVLWLPSRLRRCLVLRVLMAWPRERCAALLGLDAAEIDRAVGMAALQLANQ